MAESYRMRVSGVQDFGRVRVFRLEPEGPFFSFLPGQYVMVSLEGVTFQDRVVKRSYSIASSRQDGCIELCIAKVEAGLLSPALHSLKLGEWVSVEGPFGRFTLEPPYPKDILLIAGGTGISPIRSMIHALRQAGSDSRIRLFYGIRTPGEFLFEEELKGYAGERFELVVSVSEKLDNGWSGDRGYVTDSIRSRIRGWSGEVAYLCGPPVMVTAIVALLGELGFPDTAVKKEQW